jgi:flagellar hook-associated protein 3 FlgL
LIVRITETLKITEVMGANAKSAAALHDATKKAATGLRVAAPSDDPAGFARATRQSSGIAAYESRMKAVLEASDDLASAEGALASATDVMARAKELAVQMADGSVSAEDRALAAKEVTALRQSLIGLANTRTASGYVFAGTSTNTQPFAQNGTFNGNDETIGVEVAEGAQMRANASGARAFTAAGGRDVFADLEDLAMALATNDAGSIQAAIGEITQGHAQIVGVRSEAGLTMDRLRSSAAAMALGREVLIEARASTREVDATEAYVELTSAQAAYERSLEMTRRILGIMGADKVLAR